MCRTTYPIVRTPHKLVGVRGKTYGGHLHGAQRIPHHHTASASARGEHCARFGTTDHLARRGVMQQGDQFLEVFSQKNT